MSTFAGPLLCAALGTGRDFHNFQCLYREGSRDNAVVVGFTAAQIPHIDARRYPASLAGPLYPDGLPIWPEADLEKVIKDQKVTRCMLAYSDLSDGDVMKIAARCLAAGAEFFLVPPDRTMLPARKPVVATCAVRTGCGKSQVSRYVIEALKKHGKSCVLVRHPMPYGDLAKQAVQRFETFDDLDKHGVTIEEREEYEQHIKAGTIVYAGVDYHAILEAAQSEPTADVVIFDGGNNDTPFFKPDLWICVADPHRAGHELSYYPGSLNFAMADAIVINKANTADPDKVEAVKKAAAKYNPKARVYVTNSELEADDPSAIKGKKVLVVDDGPTLTHGGMPYGAGRFAAEKFGAAEVADPRPYFVGSINETFAKYPHLGKLVPAMGYWPEQIRDLEETINAVPCDSVVIATPMDLRRVVRIDKPAAVVTYAVRDREAPFLSEAVDAMVAKQ
ncbi:hypothetical protein DFJ74DRAFT_72715 [Hyaloraphidium curvatum]|nr:hypothetical protein DFJ74DRAFT_72715 [Hyaloraphidium curvatum]